MTTNNDTPKPPRDTRPAPPVATLQTHGTANVRRTDKPPQPAPGNGGDGSETPAPDILRVLLLEADRHRGDRVKAGLARAEFKSDVVRAESEDEFFTLYDQFQFDCLLVGALPEGADFDGFVEKTLARQEPPGLVFLADAAHADALSQAVQRGLCLVVEPHDDNTLVATLIEARRRADASGTATVEAGLLTETEERFRQIAQNMHHGFWVSQPSDGHILTMNGHFLELSSDGIRHGAGGARRFIDIVHLEDQEAVARVLDLDATRREFEFECRIQQPGGGVRWTRTHGFPIRDASGECVRIVGITEDTTDERKLRRESEQLATLLAAFPDTCLLVHADGSVGDVQLKDDAGLITPAPAGVAATLGLLLPSGPAGLVGRAVADCATDGLPRSVEFPHERAGARRHYYEARVRSAGTGQCLVFIREMPAAAQEQVASTSGGQWAALVDTLPVILFIQHRVGEWGSCLFSDGCDRLTGHAPGQLDGGELPVLSPIMHWEDVEPARAEVELADWEKRPYEIEYRVRTANGGERCFREQGHALRDDTGEIIGHEGFILDITAEQQLEAQLSELVARLGTPAASLVNGLRAPESDERLHTIEAVFRGLLHHFNSALMRIRGGCDGLSAQFRASSTPFRATETLSVIRAASGETTRMLRQLGEVILAEKASLTTQPLDLNWVAQEAIGQAAVRHGVSDPRSLNIHATFNPLPPHEGSAGLILNALTALFSSMISANTSDDRILVGTTSTPGESIMEIRLENAPLEAGSQESLRDAFVQFIGLMELQGAVAEEFATGAGLRMRLPNAVEEAPSNTAFHHAPVAARRILIVDDEPLIVEILREYLTGDGHEVVTAATGDEALVNIDAGGFDLVLTDRSMPGISGDQLAKSIHQRNPALPVVMVTGMSDVMRANGEKPEHCRMILGKPVSQASLRAALLQAVAN